MTSVEHGFLDSSGRRSRMSEAESERTRRFDALFESYSSDIVAYCSWRAGSASDAQDAVSEVFLTAWRRLDDVPEGDAARVWLYATARRVMANQRRSSRRRAALQERLTLAGARASEEPADDSEQALVRQALRLWARATARSCFWRSGRGSRRNRSQRCSGA
jgi:RNA polymerase sigma factor (sigma-70 family)